MLHLTIKINYRQMKIAIIGYGKMGKEIATIAKSRGHEISLIVDVDNADELNSKNLELIDVAIEFSSPKSVKQNIITCVENNTPVVSGTTGWLGDWDEVIELCQQHEGGLFYASNYAVGVNILFAINAKLASIMDVFPQFEVSMEETHHIHKLDAPSGTAITLADEIIKNIERKSTWTLATPGESKIPIAVKRVGEAKGFHSVTYESSQESITISHNSKTREGLATGAILAAEFLAGKTGVYGMNDMLKL